MYAPRAHLREGALTPTFIVTYYFIDSARPPGRAALCPSFQVQIADSAHKLKKKKKKKKYRQGIFT